VPPTASEAAARPAGPLGSTRPTPRTRRRTAGRRSSCRASIVRVPRCRLKITGIFHLQTVERRTDRDRPPSGPAHPPTAVRKRCVPQEFTPTRPWPPNRKRGRHPVTSRVREWCCGSSRR
jgi:hypothetical protein